MRGEPGNARPKKPKQCGLLCFAIIIAWLAIPSAHAQTDNSLSLGEAISHAIARNPDLPIFDLRIRALDGSRMTAGQLPAYELGLETEGIVGSGDQGVDTAEYTLSLSSVLEMGGKRQARIGIVDAEYDLVEAERRADVLDLLGRVTQTFISTLAIQEKIRVSAEAVDISEASYETVARRAQQGATSEADVFRAKAALAESRIELANLTANYEVQKANLAASWGETTADYSRLHGDLFRFEASGSFESLFERTANNPNIEVFANEQRVREAEVQLAQSQADSDIRWAIGARRLEATNDFSVVASASIPLFSGKRNRGQVRSALAAQEEVLYRKDNALLRLRAQLFEAYQTRKQYLEAFRVINKQIIPDLTEALSLTREGYERGRYSYLEWNAAQADLLSARHSLIETASSILLNQALIEQLTGQPLEGR
ncbi:MAG: TolC family protein [Pseudomonas sp.]|uniref:TolC family protein n=2 Tax=Halopseudomonas TaxID=2901189 RepID=A0A4U0YM25_9GAMM|nr:MULTISPECIES: TolC family protein [Halopseudomonas]TKA91629.1 TolC family protein [Halopseudomonas bauzanensis]SDT03773.1 outer membrane protein, cobalt-zinc-cadmium efflux system [Halopseudomonas litoralis]